MQAPVCQVFMLTPHTDGWVGYPMLDASDLGFDFLCSYIYIYIWAGRSGAKFGWVLLLLLKQGGRCSRERKPHMRRSWKDVPGRPRGNAVRTALCRAVG